MADVNLYPDEIYTLLNSPDGPVGGVIAELSVEATALAEGFTPVMKRKNFSRWGKVFDPVHQYGPPGATKRSVHWSGFRFNGAGQLYSGVNVNYGPTLFLEQPAEQIHTTAYRFMTHALDTVSL